MKKPLLDSFFKPDSVAVIGASEKAGSIGSTLVQNLVQGGFPGTIYPINRNYPEIHGLPAYPAITAAPEPVDLAIIAIRHQRCAGGDPGVRPGRDQVGHHHVRRRPGNRAGRQ